MSHGPYRYFPRVGMILHDDLYDYGVPKNRNLWKVTKIHKQGFGATWGYRVKNLSTGEIKILSGFEIRRYLQPYK